METFDLSSSKSSCQAIPNIPFDVFGLSALNLYGMPVICGGHSFDLG